MKMQSKAETMFTNTYGFTAEEVLKALMSTFDIPKPMGCKATITFFDNHPGHIDLEKEIVQVKVKF